MILESVKMSWSNIIHNKMRSFLTILGVLIGVAAIIALVSIVEGATGSITDQMMAMGANRIVVSAPGTALKAGLSQNDVAALAAVPNIEGVSPSVSSRTSVVFEDKVMTRVNIQGRNEVYFANTSDLLDSGREINPLDCESKNRVCLIGHDLVTEFFPLGNALDQEISINGVHYTVIGTLKAASGFSSGNDNTVVIPYTTAMGLLGTGYIASADLYMVNGDLADETTEQIEAVLNTAFNDHEDGYSVNNMQDMLDTVAEMTGMMSALLAGIASIALVVGGIGIMNMMLVSVTERTSEIGLRKALGAQPSTIQRQFLFEALFLSILGGVVGLCAGLGIAYVACQLIGTKFAVAGYSIVLALGFSALIGLVFGWAPARRASRLNPIDALRSV